MPRYKVTFPEVRHPETGKLVVKGKFIETTTDRATNQMDVLVRVGRAELAERQAPVRRVAETRAVRAEEAPTPPPEPQEVEEANAPKRTYNTRRMKATD